MARQETPPDDKKHLYYSTTEALIVAEKAGIKVSRMTIIYWVEKHLLGFQPGGMDSNWWIYKDKFDSFITGKVVPTESAVDGTKAMLKELNEEVADVETATV